MTSALCIVAHPDDETIWMGGMILKHRDWKWTIFSLCRKDDLDRAPKFKEVCRRYGAREIISNLDDEDLDELTEEEIKEKIREELERFDYDYIFTHGVNGEYGHIRHKEIHRAVKEMIQSRELKCEIVYYFSYKKGIKGSPHDFNLMLPEPNEEADEIILLTPDEF